MQGNTEWLNIHLLRLLVSQAEVTVNTSPGADLPMPSMRTTRCWNPHQEVSCHSALLKWYPVIRADCRKPTQEFVTFPGVEQVHSYLGIPVPHSETNTSLTWDNARLTCWTSHLALDLHSFLHGKKKETIPQSCSVSYRNTQSERLHLYESASLKWFWSILELKPCQAAPHLTSASCFQPTWKVFPLSHYNKTFIWYRFPTKPTSVNIFCLH